MVGDCPKAQTVEADLTLKDVGRNDVFLGFLLLLVLYEYRKLSLLL